MRVQHLYEGGKLCEQVYTGETGRNLKERLKEHQYAVKENPKNSIAAHTCQQQHEVNWDAAKVRCREHYWKRKVLEAINMATQHLQPRLWPPDKPGVAPSPEETLIKSYNSCFIALLHLSFLACISHAISNIFTTPPLLLSVHACILFKSVVFPVLPRTADEGLWVETSCIYC